MDRAPMLQHQTEYFESQVEQAVRQLDKNLIALNRSFLRSTHASWQSVLANTKDDKQELVNQENLTEPRYFSPKKRPVDLGAG